MIVKGSNSKIIIYKIMDVLINKKKKKKRIETLTTLDKKEKNFKLLPSVELHIV